MIKENIKNMRMALAYPFLFFSIVFAFIAQVIGGSGYAEHAQKLVLFIHRWHKHGKI